MLFKCYLESPRSLKTTSGVFETKLFLTSEIDGISKNSKNGGVISGKIDFLC